MGTIFLMGDGDSPSVESPYGPDRLFKRHQSQRVKETDPRMEEEEGGVPLEDKRNRDTGTYEETHQPVDFLTPPLLLSMSCTEAEEWTSQQS
ncbi:hypothetical protein D9C73_009126 [Collichthys lucidus]|uniref:Uncharacterized protein n=1 Tax=Collichthys lucidus TaxID=240159 RepID=A0A4U5UJV4_COLLU|nr:hypothetical protein D9C73_009126 [Collichthys lucidus]